MVVVVVVVVPEEVSSEEVKKKFESRLIERFQLCCQVDHLFVLPIGEGLTNLQYCLENLTNDHPSTHPIPKKSTCWLPFSSLALTSSASLSPRALLMARWYLARLGNAQLPTFSFQPTLFLSYVPVSFSGSLVFVLVTIDLQTIDATTR